jgi:enediyne biosynthesis protein E4
LIRAVRLATLAIFLLAAGSNVQAQGIAGGEARAPVYDEQNRPITAGGFDPAAPVLFADITASTGLEAFRHRSGYLEKKYILDTMAGGLALLDYNQDGWLDVYLVNGSVYAALKGEQEHLVSRLFKNNGDGTFTDVTFEAGVPNLQWGFGVVIGDFNRDGWPDIYVSNYGPNRLYQNNGDGTFTDVAEAAGVALADYWTTGATFGDYDRDGHLDLFVCGYARFNPDSPPRPGLDIAPNYCQFRGVDVMCGPRGLKGERDFLFRNNGDGTFSEVAEKAGVQDKAGYYGFSAAWVDVNDDGWVDLIVANDSNPNYLYLNNKDGTFEDASFISGFALNQDGREQAGMGIAIGDHNDDSTIDIYVTHFSDDYSTLYVNQGDTFFVDLSYEAGLGDDTIPFVSWGTAFLDYDNDGFQDLFLANGHVYPDVDQNHWGTTWAQRPLLFRNLAGSRFQLAPAAPGSGLAAVVVGRGAVFGDLDNDGRTDVVINCMDSSPKVLRNVTENKNNWVTLKLVSTKSAPDGVGATLFLTAGGRRQRRDVFTGASFMSHSDTRAHFGLGAEDQIEELEIRWPGGDRQILRNLPVNQFIEIREMTPEYTTSRPKGWKPTAHSEAAVPSAAPADGIVR